MWVAQHDVDDIQWAQAAQNNVGLYLGPAYLGPCIDMLMLGVILCQFTYWRVRIEEHEHRVWRYLSYWTFLGSLAHSGFCLAFGMTFFVYGFGDYARFQQGWWTKADFIFEIALAMPIEAFYAHRAYNLCNRSKIITWIYSILFFCCVSAGIAAIVYGSPRPVPATTNPVFLLWISFLFVIDWSLSGLIIWRMWIQRTGMQHSDRLIRRVVLLSAEAQIVPSLVTLGFILKSVIAPTSCFFMIFVFVPKLWVVTYFMVVNSKRQLRRELEAERERRQNTLNLADEIKADEPKMSNKTQQLLSLAAIGSRSTSSRMQEGSLHQRTTGGPIPNLTHTVLTENSLASVDFGALESPPDVIVPVVPILVTMRPGEEPRRLYRQPTTSELSFGEMLKSSA